jgi:hypothetical protein
MSNFQLFVLCAITALVIVVGLIAYSVKRDNQRRDLKAQFGREYDRTVDAVGQRKADGDLTERLERHEKLELQPLDDDARERYAIDWAELQARFVDEPKSAVAAADRLVTQVMTERGYPMDRFEERAELLSVDHPDLVHHYREAHEVHDRAARLEASTEDMRRALIHYRALFDDLLDQRPAAH